MIRKSMPSGHDPMGGYRFSLATNAKRLRGDHAQTKKIERDDDSKKSHPALASQIQISSACQLAQYPRCIYKPRIVARTGEDLNMISICSQIAPSRPMLMLDARLAL
jgi:hypothetical protein